MLNPNKNELSRALDAAKYMCEHDVDHHCIAKTLLFLAERNEKLETVMSAAEGYLRFGRGAAEHAELARAVALAKRSDGAFLPQAHSVEHRAL